MICTKSKFENSAFLDSGGAYTSTILYPYTKIIFIFYCHTQLYNIEYNQN